MIRVVAVDDHAGMLAGLKTLFAEHPDVQLVGTADHGSKFLDLLREHHPDAATLDLGTGGECDPVATVRAAKKEFPDVKILICTNYDDGVWVRALTEAGISGYMLKSDAFFPQIGQVICDLCRGGLYYSPQIAGEVIGHKDQNELTPRERSMLRMLAKGASTKMMADRLCVSCQRIRGLLMPLYDKLEIEKSDEISMRYAVVQKARERGLLPNIPMDANLIALLSRIEDDDDALA